MLQRRKMTENKIGVNNKIAGHQQQHHVHIARTKTFYRVSRAVWLCHRLLSLFWSFSYSRDPHQGNCPCEHLEVCGVGVAMVMLRISKHKRGC